LSRQGWWWVGLLWAATTPVSALTLELKTGGSTVIVRDNDAQDQDPLTGQITYEGTIQEREIRLVVRERLTDDQKFTLGIPSGTISNLGEAGDLTLTLMGDPIQLPAPTTLTMTYRGQWTDVTDARQALEVPRNQWELRDGDTPLQEISFKPLQKQGGSVSLERSATFDSLKPLTQLVSELRLTFGVGDTLTLETLQVEAQGQPAQGDEVRWFVLGGLVLAFVLLSVGWLRRQGRSR